MKLYGIIISICAAVIAAVNIVCGVPALKGALVTAAAVAAVILLDGIGAFLIRKLPERGFSGQGRLFCATREECKLYRRLGIRAWKDRIPELGVFTGFSKSHVAKPGDPEYLHRFLLECNYGTVIHIENAAAGFLLILCFPLSLAGITVPVAVVNAVLCIMPAMVLRYNAPKLAGLIKISSR